MQAARWFKTGSVAFVALALLIACSKTASGGSCQHGTDCESGTCALNGRCAPGDCSCTGAECGKQADCDVGSVCIAGALPFEQGYNRCRQTCAPGKACPSDQHCSAGACADSPEPFSLTWVSFPRTIACAAKVPCAYEVKVPDGITVTKFTWSFGVETTEPKASFTYPKSGTFPVSVHAVSTDGRTADLSQNEILCDGAVGAGCDPLGAPCCEGSCNAQSLCK